MLHCKQFSTFSKQRLVGSKSVSRTFAKKSQSQTAPPSPPKPSNFTDFETMSLKLPDGTTYEGKSFGAYATKAGELVFSTGMVGYVEAMTDPSYCGQILTFTYPLIGNYGVPPKDRDELGLLKYYESEKIHVEGIIVQEYSQEWSHWQSNRSLGDWLKEEGIPAIQGVDTRAITKRIRERGSIASTIGKPDEVIPFVDINKRNLVAEVSCTEPKVYGKGDVKIIAVDCGMKQSIIRDLCKQGATVKVVPWDYNYNNEDYDGLFVSNGPGDPSMATATVDNLRVALQSTVKPLFGICLGNQLMARAAGADTYKLPYGNRGQNQPVMDDLTGRCIITSQNHGYAVNMKTLPPEWREYFFNLNDGSNEGIIHTTKPFFTVQFHPEARCGPTDPAYLFKQYIDKVREYKENPKKMTFYIPPLPRPDPPRARKVLVIGNGGTTIGQAGEFDYSGGQALKALKEGGIRTVLVNPNIATIQTAPGLADQVYFAPLTIESLEDIIRKERPSALMLSFGGQTALNLGVDLHEKGLLKKYGIEIYGTSVQSIMYAEDRKLFNDKLAEIGVKVARSRACTDVNDAVAAANEIGYPVMVRVAYALGGLGSGFCHNDEETRDRVRKALSVAPQVLVEESIKGWKEAEYEVVRDQYDNCITVCNMENFDPMGIHTGESIVIAPSQTFNDTDYHWLREIAIKVVRHLGIVGECNIQYAFHPDTLDYRVIEVNPRLSRSSALASKATGYPLAAVSAKLAQGIPLPVLRNSVTKDTSANFEPSLDYVVTKAPRWDVRKFDKVDPKIGSAMKSIGEVMAVARKFEESFQKALRMVDTANAGFVSKGWESRSEEELHEELVNPTDQRVFALRGAMKKGYSVDQLHQLTRIDKWFLHKLKHIHDLEGQLSNFKGRLRDIPKDLMKDLKERGFSDKQIGDVVGYKELEVRAFRKELGIIPCMKHIDTMAAEFPCRTNYLYTTYNGSTNDVPFKKEKKGVIVLGSGVYRIGSSIEFDYGAVSCARALRSLGKETIMVNFNPETVSTDYDESDKLYFEEISLERVLDICDHENPEGVVVSVGGQLPQNIALKLKNAGVPILGTDPDNIDRAEDRYKFSKLLDSIGVDQPEWKELTNMKDAFEFAAKVQYPVLVRPSYVLSGAAMAVVYNDNDLENLLRQAADVSPEHPVVMTKFLNGAEEIEIDAVCRNGVLVNWAVSQHVEEAGIHSGDATLIFPTPYLSQQEKERFRAISEKITTALNVSGPVNLQYLYKDGQIKVIECNLRASRSLPFVCKVLGIDFVDNIAKIFVGQDIRPDERCRREVPFFGVKSPTFSWLRLLRADPRLGVEMRSTGEVACFGRTVDNAFLKSVLSSYFKWPTRKRLLVSNITDNFARELRTLKGHGYTVWTTPESEAHCKNHGLSYTVVPYENVEEFLAERHVDFVVNFPQLSSHEDPIFYKIRRRTADYGLPILTNERVCNLLVTALANHKGMADLEINSHEYYHSLY